jgi:hypothetical protein
VAKLNPFLGLHPDLFAKGGRPEHLGLPTKLEPGGMTPEQRRRHEAIQEGMTPMFVPLSDLTSEQIRELPRSAFSNEEWNELDEDDTEWIEESDDESQMRVDALAKPFIERYQWEIEGDRDFSDIESVFENYLSDHADRLWSELPDGDYSDAVNHAATRGVSEDAVQKIINEVLADTNNYEIKTRDSGGGFFAYPIEGYVYVEPYDFKVEFKQCTPDEVERAFKKIYRDTNDEIDLKLADLVNKKGEPKTYEHSFETGQHAVAEAKWSSINDAIIIAIDDVADDANLPGALPPEARVVYRWPDGFYVQDLLPAELPAEGKAMGMCVGRPDMGYGAAVRAGECKILSLRRPSGKPLFTIELDTNGPPTTIEQIKGKANRKPGFDLMRHESPSELTAGSVEQQKARLDELMQKFKKDEVQRVLEYVVSIGIDPTSVDDLGPALNMIAYMAEDGDPWALDLIAKLGGVLNHGEPPKQNPCGASCGHAEHEGEGFCRPFQSRRAGVKSNPMQGTRRLTGQSNMYYYGFDYGSGDSQAAKRIRETSPEYLAVAVDAMQEGDLGSGLRLIGFSDDDADYRVRLADSYPAKGSLMTGGDRRDRKRLSADDPSEWRRGYTDNLLDRAERRIGMRENPTRSDDEARVMIGELLTKQDPYGHIYDPQDVPNRMVARDLALEHGFDDVILKMDIEDFLVKGHLDYDAHVYTQAEWRKRGEKYGNEAPISITTEGELNGILNGEFSGKEAERAIKEFDKFLKSRGLYWDLGYSWSVHLMPIDSSAFGRAPVINPARTRFEAIDEFFKLIQEPDPAAMEIAQDLALEEKLSLAELGEARVGGENVRGERGPASNRWIVTTEQSARLYTGDAARARLQHEDAFPDEPILSIKRAAAIKQEHPKKGYFLLSPVNPADAPRVTAGWSLEKVSTWSGAGPGTNNSYLLDVIWQAGEVTQGDSNRTGITAGFAYPAQGYMPSFRTEQEARRAAAADAWAVAKYLKSMPASTDLKTIKDGVRAVVTGKAPDTTPAELYEHRSTRGKPAKRLTYVQAQDAAIDALRRAGWTLSGMLKVRHATSPGGRVRLWFKPQSVLFTERTGRAVPGSGYPDVLSHTLSDARSLNIADLRDMTGADFVEEIRRRFPAEFSTR